MVFNELNMVRLNNMASVMVIQAVGFCVGGIPNKNTLKTAGIDFWIVAVLNQNKGTAANLTKVGEVIEMAGYYLD